MKIARDLQFSPFDRGVQGTRAYVKWKSSKTFLTNSIDCFSGKPPAGPVQQIKGKIGSSQGGPAYPLQRQSSRV